MNKGTIILLAMMALTGCESRDQRLAQLASASAERQARQSEQMAEAQAQLNAGAKELVESSGRSQEALLAMQRELESRQAEIGHQRDALESERRAIARERLTNPLIANAVLQVGLLIVCVLPLLICWYALRGSFSSGADELVTEVLIEELTAESPRLLPPVRTPTSTEPAGHLSAPS